MASAIKFWSGFFLFVKPFGNGKYFFMDEKWCHLVNTRSNDEMKNSRAIDCLQQ